MSPNQAQPAFLDPDKLPSLQLEPRVDRSELVAGNTMFAVALYKQLAGEGDGNLTVSPISVSLALCMAYAGARGKTEAELKDTLMHLTSNMNLDVLEGRKVIETKNAGINKGRAALRWMTKKKRDFILAVGDDWTDEDIFSAVPESAYTIKVGLNPSQARYNIESPEEVRKLLNVLAESREKRTTRADGIRSSSAPEQGG